MKVRCENCDAVIDSPKKDEFRYRRPGNIVDTVVHRCYHCNSLNTVPTSEEYRLPKWERRQGGA